jgi:GNAT superfamily N-acetyltransferase
VFCSTDLARRIEAAEDDIIVTATAASAGRGVEPLVVPVAGGHACFAGAGSPMNKVVGAGFVTAPDPQEWDAVEREMDARGVLVQVEVSTLAGPTLMAYLTHRGYVLVGFENVLGLRLPVTSPPVEGVDVKPCAAAEFDEWLDVTVDGFAHPDAVGVRSHEDFPREGVAGALRDMAGAGTESFLAYVDGRPAGGASMRCAEGVAQLTGASTVPAYRRRGVQAALLGDRLRRAGAAGCDVAVVSTLPGSTSQKNVQAKGFALLYARATLVRLTA